MIRVLLSWMALAFLFRRLAFWTSFEHAGNPALALLLANSNLKTAKHLHEEHGRALEDSTYTIFGRAVEYQVVGHFAAAELSYNQLLNGPDERELEPSRTLAHNLSLMPAPLPQPWLPNLPKSADIFEAEFSQAPLPAITQVFHDATLHQLMAQNPQAAMEYSKLRSWPLDGGGTFDLATVSKSLQYNLDLLEKSRPESIAQQKKK